MTFIARTVKFASPTREIFLLIFLLLSATSAAVPSRAEPTKGDAARQMIREGRWTLAALNSVGGEYYVDLNTIQKIDSQIFQINVLGPLADPVWPGRKQADHVRAQTIEFDCAARRYAHVGWRTTQGLRSRAIVGGKAWNRLDVNLSNDPLTPSYIMEHHLAMFVCPSDWQGNKALTVFSVKTSATGFSMFMVLDNKIVYDQAAGIAKVVAIEDVGLSNVYVRCSSGQGVTQGPTGSVEELAGVHPALVAWACQGLHPAVVRVSESIAVPSAIRLPAQDRPDASPSNVADDLERAKKKCADLGFQAGTPKFGECVLKISE